MGWPKQKSKYESEVHLGFLAIASLLVFLNFVSNFVIFQARSAQREETSERLRLAAVAASRVVQEKFPAPLTPAELDRVREQNRLAGLSLIPVKPADNSHQARRDWFRKVLRKFPPTEYPELADKLYRAELHDLTRGDNSEYYYLYPIPAGAGGSLLVLTVDRPNLAYLDDSRNLLMLVLLGSVAVVVLIYSLLSRFMFRPFRRLKQTAALAGRSLADDADETEAVIEEYERVIRQLTESKTELLRLNKEVSRRADSLELFNRYLMEFSRSGVVTLDREGRVAAVNEIALAILSVPADREYAGRPYGELLAGCDGLRRDIDLALRHDEAWGYHEYSLIAGQPPETALGVTLTDIRDAQRKATGLLLMINDLTELNRLRRELEGRKRLAALGEMAAGLAHQIRNALGAISGYGTLLKKRLRRENLATETAEELLEETRVAGELIRRFLSFARPFEYTPGPVDLGQVVEESLEPFRVRDGCERLKLNTVLPRGITIAADPILLKQAIGNLVDNAIDAYDCRGGEVTIRVEADADIALIVVCDQGQGIPAENLDQIFTPFFSSRPSGTGLGLSLVAKIVDIHGGHVSVASEVGRGSRFTLRFPLSVAEPAEPQKQEIPST